MKRVFTILLLLAFSICLVTGCRKQTPLASISTSSGVSAPVPSQSSDMPVVSSAPSSTSQGASSAVSKADSTVKPKSVVQAVQVEDTTSSTSSIPTSSDNSAQMQAAIDKENARHDEALNDINAQYDPQITALQDEISKFKAENARDTTAEIQNGQDYLNNESLKLEDLRHEITSKAGNPDTDPSFQAASRILQEKANQYYTVTKPELLQLMSDYQKLPQDESDLTTLIENKASATLGENSLHTSSLNNINNMCS